MLEVGTPFDVHTSRSTVNSEATAHFSTGLRVPTVGFEPTSAVNVGLFIAWNPLCSTEVGAGTLNDTLRSAGAASLGLGPGVGGEGARFPDEKVAWKKACSS